MTMSKGSADFIVADAVALLLLLLLLVLGFLLDDIFVCLFVISNVVFAFDCAVHVRLLYGCD